MNWQPIETAPKDGTLFLGCDVGSKRPWFAVTDWVTIDGLGYWNMVNESEYPGEWKPTHWMPLPEPPK